MIKPFLRAAAAIGMYAGGSALQDYSERNNTATGSMAGIAGTLLKFKGLHTGLRSVTGTMKGNPYVDRVDKFLQMGSTKNLLQLGAKGVGLGVKHTALLPYSAARGALEYGGLAARTMNPFNSFTDNWGKFFTGVNRMKHPFAPAIVGGLGIGAVKAFTDNYSPYTDSGKKGWGDLSSWQYSPMKTPMADTNWFNNAPSGPINIENFGGGIQHGRSAMTSQSVMEGQRAVTTKMLRARRT